MRPLIVAEVASNHGGDLELARDFIRAAAAAGVDYVKFQSWKASLLRDGSADPQYDWFRRSELSDDDHRYLINECSASGVNFLTTVFDAGRLESLSGLGLRELKVASPDAHNYSLLEAASHRFEKLIVSTGLSTLEQLFSLIDRCKDWNILLCHSVSLYPVPEGSEQLDRIDFIKQRLGRVGYSDHTIGIEAAKVAIAKGVDYVEKHMCMTPTGPGRANVWDATPDDFAELVCYAQKVERMHGAPPPEQRQVLDKSRQFYVGRFSGLNTNQ